MPLPKCSMAIMLAQLESYLGNERLRAFRTVRTARQKAPDLGAKRSHSLAMASICNDEQEAFGVMSGHDRNTLSL